jgi:predicted ester cyclase
MGAEENKELIRRYFKAIDEAGRIGNADVLDEFMAPDFVEHNPFPGMEPTRDGWKKVFMGFVDGAPGYHEVEDLVAEGDKVVARIVGYGRHQGDLFGMPATGKDIRVSGIAIWRLREGKIVEHWHETDQVGLLQQVGVLPAPDSEAARS